MLDEQVIISAIQAIEACDLLIVVGTSGQVYPAASYPWYAKKNGAKIISVNTRWSDHCQLADVNLTGKSGQILMDLIT